MAIGQAWRATGPSDPISQARITATPTSMRLGSVVYCDPGEEGKQMQVSPSGLCHSPCSGRAGEVSV